MTARGFPLVVSPKTSRVYMFAYGTLTTFDGTPYTAPLGVESWEEVGSVPYLFAWQQNPANYGPVPDANGMVERTHR